MIHPTFIQWASHSYYLMSSAGSKELENSNIKGYAHTHIWTGAWMCLDNGGEAGSENTQAVSYYIISDAENWKSLIYTKCR